MEKHRANSSFTSNNLYIRAMAASTLFNMLFNARKNNPLNCTLDINQFIRLRIRWTEHKGQNFGKPLCPVHLYLI